MVVKLKFRSKLLSFLLYQCTFIISVSGIWTKLPWLLFQSVSQAVMKESASVGLASEGSLGKDRKMTWLLAGFSSRAAGLRASVATCLLARDHLQLFATWASPTW